MEMRGEVKRVLVTRSGLTSDVKAVLEDLKRRFPQARTTVLAQQGIPAEPLRSEHLDEIVEYDQSGGVVGRLKRNWRLARELRKRHFDLGVIISIVPSFRKIKLVALFSKPRNLMVYRDTKDGLLVNRRWYTLRYLLRILKA